MTARQYISLSNLQAQQQPSILSLRKLHWLAWSVLQVDQIKATVRTASTEEKEACCKTATSFYTSPQTSSPRRLGVLDWLNYL